MICRYEDYEGEQRAISFQDCLKLHEEMIEEIGSDSEAGEIYDELIETAAEYALLRSNWTTKPREWKLEKDDFRTSKHNSLIVKCNMLARYLRMQGKEAAWREELGYEEDDRYNRKRIGDFGCFLTYVHGINGR